jgi:transcriptional regulator GlxA family with amidase domain
MMYDKANPLRVGTLLFEGFELLDVFGPLEMFGLLGERARILMLAEHAGHIRSTQGPAALAEASIHEPRELDVLLVPGGMGTRREVSNAGLIAALARQCGASRYVASVCTGSGLLAKAGVLDGRRATSNKRAFAWATSQGPKVDWVKQARWVEDDRYFTSSGVSAGIDMALALIARLFDRDTSLEAANRAEYQWHEDRDWDPFAALNGLL